MYVSVLTFVCECILCQCYMCVCLLHYACQYCVHCDLCVERDLYKERVNKSIIKIKLVVGFFFREACRPGTMVHW